MTYTASLFGRSRGFWIPVLSLALCLPPFSACRREGAEKRLASSPMPPADHPQMNGATLRGPVYEIFVQSFADGNGDGIGDFRGLQKRLDYLVELGVEALWLMPVHPAGSYHKYDVIDYRGIHPDYGTPAEFREFVRVAHDKGLKVLIDLVLNHSSDRHPWFLEAKKGPDSPYRPYYVWQKRDSAAAPPRRSRKTGSRTNGMKIRATGNIITVFSGKECPTSTTTTRPCARRSSK